MEDLSEQIVSSLAVIHRFMSAHTVFRENLQESVSEAEHANTINIAVPNKMKFSSEILEETNHTIHFLRVQADSQTKSLNQSSTEMRPNTYVFEDGAHYDVRATQKINQKSKAHTAIKGELQNRNQRNISVIPHDSSILFTTETNLATCKTKAKPPFLNIHLRHDTTSTESKDTIKPMEPNELLESDADENASTENIMELNFEAARQKALRRRAMGRRSSETCSNYDLNRSQTSLNAILAMSRRQLSLTQSEPDSGNELLGLL